MRASRIVVSDIARQHMTQVPLSEHEHRVKALPPDRADQTLEPEPLKLGLIPIISPVCAHGPQCSWSPPLYLTSMRHLWPISRRLKQSALFRMLCVEAIAEPAHGLDDL